MTRFDEFENIIIDETDETPVRAWAYLQRGKIDAEWVFKTEMTAMMRASLDTDTNPAIVPVIVIGAHIERA